jgi:ubiquinone/menaquinone biosynthesis C-methylase UbiE
VLRQLKRAAKRNRALLRAVRATYPAIAWAGNRRAVYTRVAPYLAEMEFDEVRLGGRGNEPETYLSRTARMLPLRDSDLLVLGAGRGDELTLWEQQQPRSIVATDFFAHTAHWAAHPGTRFVRMDVRRLGFADRSFDMVASTALLEHVDGVEELVREMARVLRPGGVAFHNFGPLYYTYAGAHYLGAYEHLTMSDGEFDRYLAERNIPLEEEEARHWLRNGMFSRLRYDDYLAIFKRHFDLEHVVIGVSQDALRYRRQDAARWSELTRRYAEKDLLTFSMTVWMRPKVAQQPLELTAAGASANREKLTA